ncbi:alpha-amlyase [Sinorhizobium medicae]|uniref:alpha-amylase family glycosyl hydrolase n=2 Tax=Sinorhizobium medicae TaxID=110321 RepID=UPI000FD2ED63|nr:alpha-amylase family glycosyl hydrolase [Sinorhizobium medicae]MDX0586888.1 alpha-amylase [Sinorhizobium medicae]MDX0680122.1 alpha-amylase [Sinorhizobium medicae]MDX0712501.1 alpha-amylase [Sinorhizobium medicae]MDX0842398.1 alpha-amylase [Sinorhizobium medicae]MQW00429.1 alpha-amylase [Sinorhizobium medicae]
MISLDDVGAHPQPPAAGLWSVRFGLYLPGVTYNKDYRLKVRVTHEADQFVRGIDPQEFWMTWINGSPLDLWTATVPFVADPPPSHFGQPGRYVYRYQLLRSDGRPIAFWFPDPFARETAIGTLSAFTIDPQAQPFAWSDAAFVPPDVDQMVVYEVNVREFNTDFDGLTRQLDYVKALGVNVLELMPISNVKETVEWGYTPLDYFAPDERLGGPLGFKRLVNAAHERDIAVLLDSVYAHTHPEFTYNLVYEASGETNPMLGRFEGEFFQDWAGTDFRKAFTRDYFFTLNKFLVAEYHVDGFRYDYVPGMYDGPAGQGYADLVYRTYQHSKSITRFQAATGHSRIIQCAEHLPDAAGIMAQTHSNCAWQNGLLDRARETARGGSVTERLAHQLDPEFLGYPSEHTAGGDTFPVAPFQYLESHDHGRFINEFGTMNLRDLLGERYGNRDRFYKMQPYVIALYTGKGIPMLWHGQEFAENWGVPPRGLGRNLFERPLHWEFFYDEAGKALVRLHRILGTLRGTHRALGSRGYYYYYHDRAHLQRGVLAYRRKADAQGTSVSEDVLVLLNFSDSEAEVWLPFPAAGRWVEMIDGTLSPIQVVQNGQWFPAIVPSNYGSIYKLT